MKRSHLSKSAASVVAKGDATAPRALLRQIETFCRRVTVGVAVDNDTSKSRQIAVRNVSKKFGLSERYVWGTSKLGQKIVARTKAIIEKEAARTKRVKPRIRAGVFLLNELRDGPRTAKEIEILARKANIATRTLRRECQRLGVDKRYIGGHNRHWIWELSAETKKYFAIDV